MEIKYKLFPPGLTAPQPLISYSSVLKGYLVTQFVKPSWIVLQFGL